MYKFTKKQVALMIQLGATTVDQQDMFFEGFEEAYYEQRANGINCDRNFTAYLERRLAWEIKKKANLFILNNNVRQTV